MTIKITLPKPKIDNKERELNIRAIIGNDYENGEGLLSKVMVFTYINGPLSITKLKDSLQSYYQLEFDRVKVFRAVDRFVKLNVMKIITSGEILTMDDDEMDEVHRKIKEIHKSFLNKLSPQFRNRYNNMNYVWLPNGEGTKFLSWACKLNGFKFEE